MHKDIRLLKAISIICGKIIIHLKPYPIAELLSRKSFFLFLVEKACDRTLMIYDAVPLCITYWNRIPNGYCKDSYSHTQLAFDLKHTCHNDTLVFFLSDIGYTSLGSRLQYCALNMFPKLSIYRQMVQAKGRSDLSSTPFP